MNVQRKKAYRRNHKLEYLIKELNGFLKPVEENISTNFTSPKYPVLFIIGIPRGGTTLLMQWLAQTGYFAYPSNLLSRFFNAPAIGARIQKLLTDPDYNFQNEILDFSHDIPFVSNLGKTQGALSPNEFWYFWRRFIPNNDLILLTEDEQQKVDKAGFAAELAAVEAVFDKPFALKALILEQNIQLLASMVEKPVFVHIKRHPFFVIQSLLEARVQYYGNWNEWYSIKPREYSFLKHLHPLEQVAGQVYFTTKILTEGIANLNGIPRLEIDYRDFCKDPRDFFSQLRQTMNFYDYFLPEQYLGPAMFSHTDQIRLSMQICNHISQAYLKFSGETLEL